MPNSFVAVIPARAGSRGIKNKNTRLVAGVPMFLWSVKHALESQRISKIIVSSNDSLCDDLLQSFSSSLPEENKQRIQFVHRPDDISTDTSMSELALLHAVEQCETEPDFVIMLQPSSPVRSKGLIDRCINTLETDGSDSLLTALKVANLLWRQELPDEKLNEWLQKHNKPIETSSLWYASYHPKDRKMKQQMDISDYRYFDNGNVYITRTSLLKKTMCRLYRDDGHRVSVYPISWLESMQIDKEYELQQCDLILKNGQLDAAPSCC